MLKKIKWHDWLIIAGVAIILLINPLAGMYIVKGIIWAFESLITQSSMAISVGTTLIVIGFIGSKINKKKTYNAKLKDLSKKAGNTGKYIATN